MPDENQPRDAEPWYQGGLAFECTGCGNCCSGPQTGYVWVNDEDIQRIAAHLGAPDADAFERQFVRKVRDRKSLVEYSDGDCIFLDPPTRRCMIYEVRPSQCRTWPFWPGNLESPRAWGAAAATCPGCNRGRIYRVDEIRRLANAESET
ncbi:MAG: YkgJ family cysteine cluster protein [Planctomycetota bacterium]|jgi:Fe-S-cluster containining protein